MKMRHVVVALTALGLTPMASGSVVASSQAGASAKSTISVTIDRNTGHAATHDFKFAHVPSPVTDDAAANAKVVLVDGERDPNAGGITGLTDGLLPHDEDEPGANFFFNAGTPGGRFLIDLGSAIPVAQVNTYSWHPSTRGPQIYTLYVSDGSAATFNREPKNAVDPATVGWTRLADVDTTPKGEVGGQYGVSITDRTGRLGTIRYLLFDCAVTETWDENGNTFYSEIDVIRAAGADQLRAANTDQLRSANFEVRTKVLAVARTVQRR